MKPQAPAAESMSSSSLLATSWAEIRRAPWSSNTRGLIDVLFFLSGAHETTICAFLGSAWTVPYWGLFGCCCYDKVSFIFGKQLAGLGCGRSLDKVVQDFS